MAAALLVACLLTQAPAAASRRDDPQQQQRRAERRAQELGDDIDGARSGLARAREQRDDTLIELERIDGQRTALTAELDALSGQLADAEAAVRRSDQALRRTAAQITSTADELAVVERELDAGHDLLRRRARASYMQGGGVSMAERVLDVQAASELGVSLQYLRSLLSGDVEQVEHFDALERRSAVALEQLSQLRTAQNGARARREAERERVAGLVTQRRTVAKRLRARADEHQQLLADLDNDVRRYTSAVDGLQSESDAITRRLADLSAAQRRAEQDRRAAAAASTGSSTVEPASAGRSVDGGAAGRFQWPVNGVITSGFGYRTHPVLGTRRLHAGVDFGAPAGTPIVAVADGRVVSAGWHGGYGNAVVIDHGAGLATLYGHQSRLAVAGGARVSRGQVIGYVGSTGMSTGAHLHLEVRRDGVPVEPMGFL